MTTFPLVQCCGHSGKESVFLRHMDDIVQLVDLNTLVPILLKYGLLTSEESEVLYSDKLLTRSERKRKLAEYMASKGDRSPDLFLQALKEEPEHLGHQDLHSKLSQGNTKQY